MSTDLETMEKRLAALEAIVAEIQRRMVQPATGTNGIERIAGSMNDIPDEAYYSFVEYCREAKRMGGTPDAEEEVLVAQADVSNLLIKVTDPESPAAATLLTHLEEDLHYRYHDSGKSDFNPNQVRGPGSVFLVAHLNGVAVGCGAVRPLEPGVGEVKRLFVEPFARKRGIAGMILAELEWRARSLGYRILLLETGIRQPEALRVYERAGYRRIERYGKYVNNTESVCFEKALN